MDEQSIPNPRRGAFYSDYNQEDLLGRAIILHLFLSSDNYEDLDNPESIFTICRSRLEQWRQQVIEEYPKNTAMANYFILQGCYNIMQSLIHCIRITLRQHLVQRYPLKKIKHHPRQPRH
ncbi:hypothetical protein RF11_02332 [Thelohanellus kitauei]|uniref:Uncharacterized protein n=1 Tax=Thelohanellus kitauei TaxID=669202 RepID=A0A0C2JF44_THEKT|nr:hypothetical protein RF11_01476 [Thelohanellus kitauei]KII67868.1 hypothetical protein RF11_02332 [Thelohanellus kitauei]